MKFTAEQIAEILEGELIGNPNKLACSSKSISWRCPESNHSGKRATNCWAWAKARGTRVTPKAEKTTMVIKKTKIDLFQKL
jgi:hypothetical protein